MFEMTRYYFAVGILPFRHVSTRWMGHPDVSWDRHRPEIVSNVVTASEVGVVAMLRFT